MKKFNFLCDTLPDSITIDGINYPIYTDFRNWVKIELLLSHRFSAENLVEIIRLCYKVLPADIEKAVNGILVFYTMGGYERGDIKSKVRKAYSFDCDSEYIYSAFMQCYSIDLLKSNMHWWQFRTLFSSLGECTFTKIMHYRRADITRVKNSEQKAFYRKMKRIYRLPDRQCAEDIGMCLDNLF